MHSRRTKRSASGTTRGSCAERPAAVIRALTWCLLAGVWASLAPTPAEAQTKMCLPEAYGVPALSGPPRWWDANGNGAFPEYPTEDDRLLDPRWNGATARSDNNTQSAFFRGLREGSSFMDLSWEYADDPAIHTNADALYFGFIPPPATTVGARNDTIFIAVLLTAATPLPATKNRTFLVQRKVGGVWQPEPSTPGWLEEFTRAWIKTGLANYAGTGTTSLSWAIQMHIPTTDSPSTSYETAIRTGPGTKFFWVLSAKQSASGPFVQISWPSGFTLPKSAGEYGPPPFANWGEISMTGGCTGGLSLAWGSVGPTQLNFTKPAVTPLPPDPPPPTYVNMLTNTFFVRPTNNTGSAVAAGTIKARVRVAQWGIQPDWNDLGAGVSRDLVWKEIPISAGQESNRNTINNGTTANATNDIHFDWTVQDCEVFDMMSPRTSYPYPAHCLVPPESSFRWDKRPHRCIYAEIYSNQPLDFANYSIYQNANFVGLSSFAREFEVTTVGLKRKAGQRGTAVYLYTTATNMPRRVSAGGLLDVRVRVDSSDRQIALLERLASTGLPFDPRTVEQSAPAYRVRGFYATGDSTDEGGTKRFPIVKPGTSITYYPIHKGPLVGYTTEMTSVVLQSPTMMPIRQPSLLKVSDDLPQLVRIDMPDNARLTLATKLQAVEPADTLRKDTTVTQPPTPKPSPNCPFQRMNLGVVGGLAMVGLMTSRRRRRDDEPLDSDPPETSR